MNNIRLSSLLPLLLFAALRARQEYRFPREMIHAHPSMTEALDDLFGQVTANAK